MQHGSGPLHSQSRPLWADMNKICQPHYIRPKRPAPTETAGWIAVIEIQWPQQKDSVCWSRRRGRGTERRTGGNYSQSILPSSSSSSTTFSAAPRARKHRGRRLRCRPSRAKESVCRCSVTQRYIAMLLLNPTTHTHTHARAYTRSGRLGCLC